MRSSTIVELRMVSEASFSLGITSQGIAALYVRRAGPLFLNRATPRVAVFEPVPVGDLVLTELPAEQDLLTVAQGRKIDEAGIEVLDHHAHRLNLPHRAC